MHYNFTIPDITAFTLLGISPNLVSKPGTAKELAGNILNVISDRQNISPGIAIDWSPYQTFGNTHKNRKEYKEQRKWRDLQISYGSIKDSLGTKVSIGVRWVFIDKTDILLDDNVVFRLEDLDEGNAARILQEYNVKMIGLLSSVDLRLLDNQNNYIFRTLKVALNPDSMEAAAINPQVITSNIIAYVQDTFSVVLSPAQKDRIELLVTEYHKCYELLKTNRKSINARVKAIKERHEKESWNKALGHMAAGVVLNSADGTWKQIESERFSSFIGYAFPVGRHGQVILQGKYASFLNASSLYHFDYSLGGRLLLGNEKQRFSLEGVYLNAEKNTALVDINDLRSTVGFEFKVVDNIWLELAFGVNAPSADFEKSSIVSLGTFKYSFNQKPRYAYW